MGEIEHLTEGGTLQVHIGHQVCGFDVDGTWSVAGGTGLFRGAVGGGVDVVTASVRGNDPALIHTRGTLSY